MDGRSRVYALLFAGRKEPFIMKRQLRNLQTFFPFIRSAKFGTYNAATRYLGARIEPEFRMLAAYPAGGVALDIGGNWGQSILAFQRMARPSKIISFEPNQVLAQRLVRVFGKDPKVVIHSCALSDEQGEFDLYVPQYRNYVYDGLASLDEEEARGWLNPQRMTAFDPDKLHVSKQNVPVKLLDSFGLNPDFVKIDVQGAELSVVKGGIETFRKNQPVAIIEGPCQELVALLDSIGLKAYRLHEGKLDDAWMHASNSVFLSDKRRAEMGL